MERFDVIMNYDITYNRMKKLFSGRMKSDGEHFLRLARTNPANKKNVAVSWLWEFDESALEDAERLNVLLPLIRWSIEQNMMIDFLENELNRYYSRYINNELGDILAEYEAKEVITDLIWCYKTHFKVS